MSTPVQLLLIWLAAVNLLAFALMGLDKWKARNDRWRIPEKTLFLFPLLGGPVGGIAGMRCFRHKTKHWYFKYGIPAICILEMIVAGYVWLKIKGIL